MDNRRWWVLGVLSTCLLMVALDATILNVALPSLVADLKLTSLEQLWVVNGYALVLAGFLVTMAALGDRTGRKRILCAGLVVFGLASLIPVLAPDPAALIAARGLLGLGGAMIMPSTLSIIRNTFDDERERTRALAIWATIAGVGAAIGPILGGFLLEHFHWNSVFLVNIPIVLVTLAAGLYLIRESFTPSSARWDWTGVVLSCAGLAALVQGIKMTAKEGPFDWQSGGFFVLGVVLLALFARRQLSQDDPMVDVRLFSSRSFSVGVAVYLLAMVGFGALMFLLTQWLQFVKGMSPMEAGLALLPAPIASMAASLAGPRILDRWPARTAMAAGIALLGAALVVPSAVSAPGPVLVGISLALMGFGLSLALISSTVVIMAFAPPERTGGAASIQETSYELGNVLGVAVLGSLTVALYRRWLDIPPGTPPGSVTAAQDSIGEAVLTAGTLPAPGGPALADAARDAFSSAFSVTGVGVGIAMILLAVAVFFLVPPVKATAAASH
ncbi:MFS transporter [Longispora albida]|uniref:MFS transporter n=1 Tax=Longispora albida TaxID=203523 RepID=UPI000367C95B|nr:MFS transporter [Longispora albida]